MSRTQFSSLGRRTFLLGSLFAVVSAQASTRFEPDDFPPGQVRTLMVYVPAITDGDTFYVEVNGTRRRVRLAEVDAPESGQPFGHRSEQSLRELVWKKQVQVTWSEVDRYGRPIVSVKTMDGIDVGAEQVRRGLAWVYRRYAKDQRLYPLEDAARTARIGLWADPSPQPPWEWRKEHRPPQP